MNIKDKRLRSYTALSVLIILCLIMASAMTFFMPKDSAKAIKSADMSSQSTNLGEMLLDGYENGGKVFNADVFWKLISRVSGGSVTNKTQFDSWSPTMKTSADFRSYNNSLGNGAKDIVVTIGGKQWIATYLSKTTTNAPILTFWLANSSTTSSWGYSANSTDKNYNNSWQNQYTSNLYGTSFIRTTTLNNGGYMAMVNTSSKPSNSYNANVSQSATSEWAIYTVPNTTAGMNGRSLTEFIEVPNKVSWQQEQQALNSVSSNEYANSYGRNNNNDALNYGSKNTVGGISGAGSTKNYYDEFSAADKKYYNDWGNDRLWLPSVTETGVSGEEGIWKAINSTRANSTYSWLRSAAYIDYCNSYVLAATGSSMNTFNVDFNNNAVRPAFHLKLSDAANAVGILEKPATKGDTLKYHTGSGVTFELDKINQDLVNVEFTAEYLDSAYTNIEAAVPYTCTPSYANGVMSFSVQNVGKYTVKVTPKTGETWKDGTRTTETYTYTLKYKVTEPKFTGNATSIEGTYDGNEQSFAILNYDENKMNIKSDDVDGLTFETSPSAVFKVQDAKTSYVVPVALKNKTLMEWSTAGDIADKSLTVTIKKKQVAKPKLSDDPPSKDYTGNPLTFGITGMSADVVLKDPNSATVTSITQTNAGTYVYTISLADKNNTEWRDEDGGGTADGTLTVYIKSSGIAKPSLSSSAELFTQEKTYSTTTTPKGATFTVYHTAGTTITPADSTQTDAVLSGNTITVTKVGTYTFTVSLADSTNTKWDDDTSGTYDLIIKVKAKEVVKPTLSDNPPTKDYTGNPLTFGVTGMSADVELKDPNSATVATITQTNADTYDYTATLVDPINTVWVGGGTATVHLPVTIARKNIDIPYFATGTDKKTYNGSNQPFNPSDFNANYIEIEDMEGNIVTAFEETNARTYIYKLNLKDTLNTQWKGTNADVDTREIRFTIEKKTLNITSFTCSESGNPPAWEIGKDDVTFTIVEDSLSGDTVKLKLYREQSGVKAYDLTGIDETVPKTVMVTLPDYLPQGSYVLGVELADPASDNDNGNYTLSMTNTSQYRKTFVVKGQGLILTEENMPWVYKYTDRDSGVEQEVSISAQEGETARKVELTYTGYEYEFTVNTEELLALGAVIDTSKGVNGFGGDTKWTNATTSEKTITVYWKTAEGYESASGSFQLKYYIEKAKYDLTNTKWNYTNPFDFDPLLFRTVSVIDLPEGLSINNADYLPNSNRQKNAKKYTAELLAMQNSNSNYYDPLPGEENKNTYIYNKGDNLFPWTLEWEILPQKLNLKWNPIASENNDFTYWKVGGDEEAQVSGYLIYKGSDYNNTTGIATGDPIELSNIVVPKKQVDVYWVVAVLVDANNYEVVSGKAQRFTVGSLKEMVKVELKDTQPFVYNGNQYGKDIIVTSDEGTLTTANIVKRYYKDSVSDENLLGSDAPSDAGEYILVVELQAGLEDDYELAVKEIRFEIEQAEVEITLSKNEYKYDGQDKAGEFVVTSNNYDLSDILMTYYKGTKDFPLADGELPCIAGKYIVVFSLADEDKNNYKIKSGCEELEFTIAKAQIVAKWVNGENNIPMLSGLDEDIKGIIGYIYYDEEGNQLDDNATLEAGKSYKVKAIFLGDNAKNYEFVSEDGQATPSDSAETEQEDFTVSASNNGGSLGGVNGEEKPPATTIDIIGFLKDNWQLILSLVSIVLTLIFMGKGFGYAGKRKKIKKTIDKKYGAASYYAVTTLCGAFGLPNTTWTIVACTLAGVAVLAFIFMLLEKRMLNKAQEEFDDAKDEYEQAQAKKRDEEMRMMLMGMMGGNSGQQGYAYVSQPQIGLEDMRGMINDAVTAMLPNVQQYLPQQASGNDDLVEKLLEKTAKNEETIQKLIKKIAEQPTEKVVETVVAREVASANANDETIKKILENQELLMEQIKELSAKQNAEPQVVEKIVEVPVEVEKIVEKEVVKEVPVEVEKIVEKVVEKEVKVEVEVPVAVTEPSKPKKETAPKLTLDEAYAGLSKQQQKYFDGLRQYALTKDKCKEKKSTYFILFGQSSVNPLMKLTIKKDTVVALFKMEDEYMKDIRKDATSDGTKVKVKETEVIISDAQACKVAKNMIDLREDQIERYADLLKEQRSLRNKK